MTCGVLRCLRRREEAHNRTSGPKLNMQETLDEPKLKEGRIDWVLVQLRDEDPAIENNVNIACRIAEENGADFDLFGSQIAITFGTLVDDEIGRASWRERV